MNPVEKYGLIAGLIGFVLLVLGVSLVSFAAGLIVAGLLLMAWSAMVARSVARTQQTEKGN